MSGSSLFSITVPALAGTAVMVANTKQFSWRLPTFQTSLHLPWRASWGSGRHQSASPSTLAPFHSRETHHSDRLKAFKIRKLIQSQRIHTEEKPYASEGVSINPSP